MPAHRNGPVSSNVRPHKMYVFVRIKLITAVFASYAAAASAQEFKTFSLRENLASAKAFQEVIATSSTIPLRKPYSLMNETETAAVRSLYIDMGHSDEPPFPKNGLEPLVRLLHQAQSKLLVAGDLYLIADVNAEGDVSAVTAYGSPSPEMTKFAASALVLEKFKPALCKSVPCSQKFPFALKFAVN